MPLPIEPVKDFRKAVESVAWRGHHRNEIFRDFVSLALYSIVKHSILVANASGAKIKSDPEAWEQNYMTVMRRYTEHAGKEDATAIGNAFATMMASLVLYTRQTDSEAVSELFEEYASSDALGQFFTPKDVVSLCAMIHGMDKIDFSKYSLERPCRIYDPTCGGGRMLIYPALQIPKDKRALCEFHGTDIDKCCVEMTAFNLALFNLRGYVVHGNALTNESWGGYRVVPSREIFAYIIPLTAEECDAEIKLGLRSLEAKHAEAAHAPVEAPATPEAIGNPPEPVEAQEAAVSPVYASEDGQLEFGF